MGAEHESLKQLLQVVTDLSLPLELPQAESARAIRKRSYDRLRDHILPRLENLDAPLLCVVGGSTGAGKSTIVNTLLGQVISASSAVRPTTRRPILMHRAEDKDWFEQARILPGLARVRVAPTAGPSSPSSGKHTELELREVDTVPSGIALLDAPDLDSVVDDNRELARQLLDAADMWVFVTTAARYADAVPWQTLREAARRDISVTIMLNRIPPGADQEIRDDLSRMLAAAGLAHAPVLCIDEQPLDSAMLPARTLMPLRNWLASLADTAAARSATARRAVHGSVLALLSDAKPLVAASWEQARLLRRSHEQIDAAGQRAQEYIAQNATEGTLLRGEVLSRWQEVLGAADLTKTIDASVSWMRSRLSSFFGVSNDKRAEPVHAALGDNLTTLITTALIRADEEVRQSWRRDQALAKLEANVPEPTTQAVQQRAAEVTRQWQHDLLEMVREQGGARKNVARMMAIGVNLLGVALMVVVFASTGGLTGAEVGVAGATSVVAQKLLESVFGSQEVAAMTRKAVQLLELRCQDLIAAQLAPLRQALPAEPAAETLMEAATIVDRQWHGTTPDAPWMTASPASELSAAASLSHNLGGQCAESDFATARENDEDGDLPVLDVTPTAIEVERPASDEDRNGRRKILPDGRIPGLIGINKTVDAAGADEPKEWK